MLPRRLAGGISVGPSRSVPIVPESTVYYGPPYSNAMLIWQSDTVLRLQHTFREWPLLDNHFDSSWGI